jgi:hypothetical protein
MTEFTYISVTASDLERSVVPAWTGNNRHARTSKKKRKKTKDVGEK